MTRYAENPTAYRREHRARWRARSASEILAELTGKAFATVPEVSVVLRTEERAVRRSIEAGDIPSMPVGSRQLVPVTWLFQAVGREASEAGS